MVLELCTKEQLSYRLTFGSQTYKKPEFFELEPHFYRKSFQIVPFDQVVKVYADVDRNKLFDLLSSKSHSALLDYLTNYSESNAFSYITDFFMASTLLKTSKKPPKSTFKLFPAPKISLRPNYWSRSRRLLVWAAKSSRNTGRRSP